MSIYGSVYILCSSCSKDYNKAGDSSVEEEIQVSKVSTIRTVSVNQFSSELNKWRKIKNKYNSSGLRSSSSEYIGEDWKELSIENSGFDNLSILINEKDSQKENNNMLAYFIIDGFIEGEFLISEYFTEDGTVLDFKNKVFNNKSFAVLFKDNGDVEVRKAVCLEEDGKISLQIWKHQVN